MIVTCVPSDRRCAVPGDRHRAASLGILTMGPQVFFLYMSITWERTTTIRWDARDDHLGTHVYIYIFGLIFFAYIHICNGRRAWESVPLASVTVQRPSVVVQRRRAWELLQQQAWGGHSSTCRGASGSRSTRVIEVWWRDLCGVEGSIVVDGGFVSFFIESLKNHSK